MFVRTHELKNGVASPLNKEGPTVQVLEQTQDHEVIFQVPGSSSTKTLPDSEFFQTHREATGDEIDAATEAARGPAPQFRKPAATKA